MRAELNVKIKLVAGNIGSVVMKKQYVKPEIELYIFTTEADEVLAISDHYGDKFTNMGMLGDDIFLN